MEVFRRDSHIIILSVSELLNCVLAQLRKCNWAHTARSGMNSIWLGGISIGVCMSCISLPKLVRVNSPNFLLYDIHTHVTRLRKLVLSALMKYLF